MPTRRQHRRSGQGFRRWAAVAAILAAAAGSACSGDDEPAADGTSPSTTEEGTTATPSSTTTGAAGAAPATTHAGTPESTTGEEPGSVEDAVVAAYLGFWDARFAANSPPDPDAPALAEYATGPALEDVRAEAESNRTAGVEFRRADEPEDFRRVRVVDVGADTATVQDCVVDDVVVVRRADGSVVNDVVATHSLRGDLRRVDGRWRLAESRLLQRWEGVAGCAVADE